MRPLTTIGLSLLAILLLLVTGCGAPDSPARDEQIALGRTYPINGSPTQDCTCWTTIPDCLCVGEVKTVKYGFYGTSTKQHKLCIEPAGGGAAPAGGPSFNGSNCTPCVSCPSEQEIDLHAGSSPGEYIIRIHECPSGSAGKECGRFCVYGGEELLPKDDFTYKSCWNHANTFAPWAERQGSKLGEFKDDCGSTIQMWCGTRFPGSGLAYVLWLVGPHRPNGSLGAVCLYPTGANRTYVYVAKCGTKKRIAKVVHKNMLGNARGDPVTSGGLYYWYEYTILLPCHGEPTVTAREYSSPNSPGDYTPGLDDLPVGSTPTGQPQPPIEGATNLPVGTPLGHHGDGNF